MALLNITSPHTHGSNKTSAVMQTVIIATLPGVIAMVYFFGPGVLINLVLVCCFSIALEALVLALRRRPILFFLNDYSAVVTAVLLAIALPPYAPWWLLLTGSFFSIVVGKQLYGGLGYNPFNPAMVGYVVLLISFPVEMTRWAAPGGELPNIGEALSLVFLGNEAWVDGYTAATPLDVVKQNKGALLDELYQSSPAFVGARWAGLGWEWVNLGFLLGGVFLLYKKIFTWHAPLSMLAVLLVMATIFYDGGSSSSAGSPLFHLLSGATMLGAFFIITDPVSSAVSVKGRIIYGALIGMITYVIRVWGNYPDAVAFAVLLMNFAAPFIDYFTPPRTYGHSRAKNTTGLDK